MAKKRRPIDPSIETPTTPGTAAQGPPPETASPAGHAESGETRSSPAESGETRSRDAAGGEAAAKKPCRQTAAPACPECGTRCVAGSSPAGATYYYCPVEGCGYSTKQARPASGLGVPACPYHQTPCELDRKASNSFFVWFRCPEPGCHYREKRARPNLPTRRRLAEAGDQSAR